jgi:hypothetical protein
VGQKVKRITVPLALALLATLLAFAVTSESAVAASLKVTERLSSSSPSTSTTIHITVCWANARRGDTVELDEQSLSSLLWKAVSHEVIGADKGCQQWTRSSGPIGNYPYRAEVRSGRPVVGTSPVTVERTFGTIPASSLFVSEFGCQGGGTVSSGSKTYPYFCSLSAGPQSQSDYLMFSRPTTCSSMTLSMTATGNAKGNPSDNSTVTVELQQANSVQPAIFVDNQVENFTYRLSANGDALNIWDNPGNSDGDAAYFLTNGSTAYCSSTTGV